MSRFCVSPMQPGDYVDATHGRAPWEPSAWEAACERLDHGCAWTARVDGAIAAVGGLERLWPGVATAWLCVTPVGQAHPVFVVRALGRCLMDRIETEDLRRVQADVCQGDDLALRLLVGDEHEAGAWRGFGFEKEGRMRRYGPNGEDFIRYARVLPA